MMRGFPGSGKSTVAESLQKEVYIDAVRLNKDLLREMFHFGEYNWSNEKFIMQWQETLAQCFLDDGIDVIIDDTNLKPYHENKWRKIAEETESQFIVIDQKTDWKECCVRDSMRAKPVGSDVIKKFAMELGQVEGEFVICDLDGTLCDIDHRLHHVKQPVGQKDWKSFFEELKYDDVRLEVAERIEMLNRFGYKIVYLSGRPEDHKEATEKWLGEHFLNFNFTLIMRRKGDKRDDVTVKREFLNKYFPDKSKICCVVDDRPSVIRMWREELPETAVIDVGKGVEF